MLDRTRNEITDSMTAATAGQLKSIVERIERLDEEQRELGNDKRDVLAEAKAVGFDPKVIRKIVQIRRQDASERQEQKALLEVYLFALGMPL